MNLKADRVLNALYVIIHLLLLLKRNKDLYGQHNNEKFSAHPLPFRTG